MKKGFTLMEILAVLLIIAVIAAFAVPAITSVRAELRYQRAKAAALKMGEAIRAFYRDTRGYLAVGGDPILGSQASKLTGVCSNPGASGIPTQGVLSPVDVRQLFYCNYLTPKDFVDLPYKFEPYRNPRSSKKLVKVTSQGEKAGRYKGKSFDVNLDMTITGDTEEMDD